QCGSPISSVDDDRLPCAESRAAFVGDRGPLDARPSADLPANPAAYDAIQQARCRRSASNCGLFYTSAVLKPCCSVVARRARAELTWAVTDCTTIAPWATQARLVSSRLRCVQAQLSRHSQAGSVGTVRRVRLLSHCL